MREKSVWEGFLDIPCGGYDSRSDEILLEVITLIGRKDKDSFLTDIVKETGESEAAITFALYILTNAEYQGELIFSYGTSPRGLFVSDWKGYWQLLKALRKEVADWNSTEQS